MPPQASHSSGLLELVPYHSSSQRVAASHSARVADGVRHVAPLPRASQSSGEFEPKTLHPNWCHA